jgi:hypothetical protein
MDVRGNDYQGLDSACHEQLRFGQLVWRGGQFWIDL